MRRPLHHADIYADLAAGPAGTPRTWARTQLALVAPERLPALPNGPHLFDVAMVAAGDHWVGAFERALDEGALGSGLCATVGAASTYGLLPEDPTALIAATKRALASEPSDGALWLALLLTQLGAADSDTLNAAAAANNPDAVWVLPYLVCMVAGEGARLELAATAIARELTPVIGRDGSLLMAVLGVAEVPFLAEATGTRDPAEAARIGAEAAGGTVEAVRPRPGSRKRQTQRWVAALLDGVPGAGAALLRAIYAHEPRTEWGMWPVAAAAWLRVFEPGDPVIDVLTRHAGCRGSILSAARRAHADPDALLLAIQGSEDAAPCVLAADLLRDGNDAVANAIFLTLADLGAQNHRILALAELAAATHPHLVADLLVHPGSRDLGLLLCGVCLDEAVLEALLSMEVPADEDAKQLYASSLASMADQAAVPVLNALFEADTEGLLVDARELCAALLGQA